MMLNREQRGDQGGGGGEERRWAGPTLLVGLGNGWLAAKGLGWKCVGVATWMRKSEYLRWHKFLSMMIK